MKPRVAAPTLVGGSLVVLVAVATVAVAWLLWTRADDRAEAQNDRAAQAVDEALENSIGRVLTSLRAAAGLVDANGDVDRASFQAYARAVSSIGATAGLGLAEIVPADGRSEYERVTRRRITEAGPGGRLRAAGARRSYIPVVAVWPDDGSLPALLGFDLMSSPERRHALELSRDTRQTAFTGDLPFVFGGRGFQAFRPVYAPDQERGAPIGYVTTWFTRDVIASVLSRLPSDVRARVEVGDTPVFATRDAPSSGATRTVVLGGREWRVTARGEPVSHASSLAILVGGAILALMLATFTWARGSSDRRLRRVHDAERAARERSELLARTAGHLGADATAPELAAGTVADLVAAGVDVVAVYVRREHVLELLAADGAPADLAIAAELASQSMSACRTIDLVAGDALGEPAEEPRASVPFAAVLAVPLLGARREVVGALVAGSHVEGRLVPEMRLVLVGVAEQLGVALERARLRGLDDEARRRADLLQRLAASLSRAALPVEVAEASIPYLLEAFDAALATVGLAAGDDVRTLKVPRDLDRNAWAWRPVPRSTSTPTADAMRERRAIELHGRERIHDAYPPEVEQLLAGVASMLVVPFSRAAGAAGVAFEDDRVLSRDERRLLDAIADELTRSLERAALLEGERDARLQAELMERHAARLAAATSAAEVAAATVAELEAFGADVVLVWSVSESPDLDVLGSSMRPELAELGAHPLGRAGLVADVMRERKLITFDTAEEYDARYPRLAGVRATLGAESLAALPLRTARGEIVGAILAVSRRRRWIAPERRPLLLGIAEQTGVALERARLQGEVERVAEDSTFLALLGESLERATTVHGRARRVVEELADGRATFAAIHLLGEEGEVDEVARAGSLPAELADVRRWREWIERVAATGREPSAEVSAGDGASAPGSLLVLPLQARGRSLGVLTLRLAAGVDRKPVITPAVAREVAARAALALDNAVLYERERGVSHALQLGLLGGALPDFEKVVVTPAYRAGTAALEVGGDWYDAFSLLSGSSAFVVGDVVGHGLEAAVAMGQLRGAVSALAQTSAPAELLDQLDAFVENVPSAATATLAFVDLDPESGDFRYACAGHPPPLVISPDGRTRYLWEGRSAPLGSMLGDRRGDAEGHLAEGETLVLYTDGLVERRSESIDAGLERLADAARLGALGAPALADEICDRLLDAQVQDDDVCVLTIHRMPEEAMFSRSFRASPSELADLRERLRRWLEEQGVAEDVERGIVLAVSEAAANAVEHGYGCDGVGLVTVMARAADDRLEVTVRDEGAWREPRRDTDRGRGIEIMRAIMDEVRVDRDGPATVISMSQRAQQTAST